VKTDSRQGCMLSPFLFALVINWITKQSMDRKGIGICEKSLEDSEFADDVALLCHSFNHMQEKTHCLEANASSVGIRINKVKSKIMKVMADCL